MSSGSNLFKSQIAYSDFKAKVISQLLTRIKSKSKNRKAKQNGKNIERARKGI